MQYSPHMSSQCTNLDQLINSRNANEAKLVSMPKPHNNSKSSINVSQDAALMQLTPNQPTSDQRVVESKGFSHEARQILMQRLNRKRVQSNNRATRQYSQEDDKFKNLTVKNKLKSSKRKESLPA